MDQKYVVFMYRQTRYYKQMQNLKSILNFFTFVNHVLIKF